MRFGFFFGSASLGAIALATAGCAGVPTGLASGQPCVRSEQCQPGLVCGMGACTNDLTGFGMGTVPVGDAGPIDAQVEDAGDEDAGPPIDMDAGPLVEMDSGPPVDAFVPGVDAFVPEVDAFVPAVDAFVPEVDAFVPEVDAFVPEVDAFVPDEDAGI